MNKYAKMVLIASLALNGFLGGMVCGHLSHRFMGHDGSSHIGHMAQLPPEKRQMVMDTMHTVWQDTGNIRSQMADARKEASRLLQANPINEDAYLTQIQHISDLHAQMKRQMAQAMVALAQKLAPDERAILTDIISRPPPQGPLADGGKPE